MPIDQQGPLIRRLATSLLAATTLSLAGWTLPTAATAAVTETHLQALSPTGAYLTDDEVTPASTVSVSGASDGTAGEMLDINCYAGKGFSTLAKEVEVQAGGGFAFTGSMKEVAGEACVLRAVPHEDFTVYAPGSPTVFTGPVLAIGTRRNDLISSGPNTGMLERYYVYGAQLTGAFDYASLGGCSISDSYVYDPVTLESVTLDYCNAWFDWANGEPRGAEGFLTPTRSELQVDGADAYPAGAATSLFPGSEQVPGYPGLAYSYSIDPASGDLVLEETDTPVKCSPGGAYPPTSVNCSSFVPAGIEVQMRIVQGQGGRVASVAQWFSSTDGQPHQLDLLEDNQFYHPQEQGELEFPWTGEGLKQYTTAGQTLPAAPVGPGSFFVKGAAEPADGSEETAVGAVTFADPPEAATIVGTTDNTNRYSWVDLGYRRTVPATGSVVLGFTYSDAFLRGEVDGYAAAAQAAYLPSVSISAPGAGSVVGAAQVTISGTASDQTGLTSLVVNGQSVPVGANGAWTATVPVNAGANTITATATNVFGYTAQSHIALTYVPPAPGLTPHTALTYGPLALGLTHVSTTSKGVSLTLSCEGAPGGRCTGAAVLSSVEHLFRIRLTGVTARGHKPATSKRTVTVGSGAFALSAGQNESVLVLLNSTGRNLLARFHPLPLRLQVSFTDPPTGKAVTIARRTLAVKAPRPKNRKHRRR